VELLMILVCSGSSCLPTWFSMSLMPGRRGTELSRYDCKQYTPVLIDKAQSGSNTSSYCLKPTSAALKFIHLNAVYRIRFLLVL